MNLSELLQSAGKGEHAACQKCPSSPKKNSESAFGISCQQHGLEWSLPDRIAVSITIARDPANTTPATTGKLCIVCNSSNASDGTAQHAFALWRAGIALAEHGTEARRYLDRHYWTNAAMHGTDEQSLREARRCCTEVLNEQIIFLSPRVIIASGTEAATSLYELRLLSKPWRHYNNLLEIGAYSEVSASGVWVFCTYHTSKRAVNFTVEKLYSEKTEELLRQKSNNLPDTSAIDAFLRRYSKFDREGRGMRVLLLHWLDIGESVRQVYDHA